MNILTLSIKQKYFDEILAGKKTLRSISLTYVAVKNIRLMQNCLKKVK